MSRLLNPRRFLLLCASLTFLSPALRAQEGGPFAAEEVAIKTNGYTLAGTLLLPRKAPLPAPAVVMITGSGQQTRDSQIPMPGLEGYRPFKQIAEHLAARGIAVLRVDDRGVGGSTGKETLESATTSGFADDTRAQIAFLRGRREIDPDRIALVGHSEGGSIALMVASSDPRVRCVVLMGAMGKTGLEVNLEQQEYALSQAPGFTEERKAQLREQQRQILRAVVEGGDVSAMPADFRRFLPWFKEFLTFDPLPLVRRLQQPVLILQGGLDRQITPEHASLLERAARGGGNRDVQSRVFPRLNHLFLLAETGAWSEYSSLVTTSLSDDVLDTLGGWLTPRLQRGKKKLNGAERAG
ncbi:MAG TPA: alpha/beta fold hydrolase [Pyrinomonadaceae bacterium]|nr:alpha/beta fold hydrolase [Pyrinomonadaceae bacterium]